MKQVNYELTARVNQLHLLVTDILGNYYHITEKGRIVKSYYSEDTLYVQERNFDDLTEYANKYGLYVTDTLWVKVAKLELLKTKIVEVKKLVSRSYLLFKPTLKYSETIECKEV